MRQKKEHSILVLKRERGAGDAIAGIVIERGDGGRRCPREEQHPTEQRHSFHCRETTSHRNLQVAEVVCARVSGCTELSNRKSCMHEGSNSFTCCCSWWLKTSSVMTVTTGMALGSDRVVQWIRCRLTPRGRGFHFGPFRVSLCRRLLSRFSLYRRYKRFTLPSSTSTQTTRQQSIYSGLYF